MWTESRFISFDKTPIFYRYLRPARDIKAFLVLLHGLGEHGGRYRAFAEVLAESGFEIFLPDLRGFGESGGKRGCVRHFSDFHKDLDALMSFLERNQKGTPVFLMAHSFGALVASSYLAFYPGTNAKALIMTSPLFGVAISVPLWRHALGMAASWALPDFVQGNGVTPDMLTHDKAILEAYPSDRLNHHRISSRLYREICGMTAKRREIAAHIQIPTLLLQAGEDRVVSKETSLRFFDELKTKDKEIEVCPGLYHEILNEVGREQIFSKISRWLVEHMSPSK